MVKTRFAQTFWPSLHAAGTLSPTTAPVLLVATTMPAALKTRKTEIPAQYVPATRAGHMDTVNVSPPPA